MQEHTWSLAFQQKQFFTVFMRRKNYKRINRHRHMPNNLIDKVHQLATAFKTTGKLSLKKPGMQYAVPLVKQMTEKNRYSLQKSLQMTAMCWSAHMSDLNYM